MKIIKQKRKILSLKIDKQGEVILKVPLFCSKKQVDIFVEKHKGWIEKQQQKVLEQKQKFKIREKFLYFGTTFPLAALFQERGIPKEATSSPIGGGLRRGNKGATSFSFEEKDGGGGSFFTNLQNPEDIKQAFITFYKKEAKNYIVPRVHEIADELNLTFKNIRITSATTRWGSCSSKKNVNFSWRLAMVPKNLIDYVIIHELAHLTEMNHSQKFWNLVERYYTILGKIDYKAERKELQTYSGKTNF